MNKPKRPRPGSGNLLFDERIIQISGSVAGVAGNNLYDAYGFSDKPTSAYADYTGEINKEIGIPPGLYARGYARQSSQVDESHMSFKGAVMAWADNLQVSPGKMSACSLSLFSVGLYLGSNKHITIKGKFDNTNGDTPGPEFSHVAILRSLEVQEPILYFYNGSEGFSGQNPFSETKILTPGFYVIKGGVFCNVAGIDNDAEYAMEFKLSFE